MRLEEFPNYLTLIAFLLVLSTGLVFAQPDDIPRQDPSKVDIDPQLESKFESQGFSLFSSSTVPKDVIVRLQDVEASKIDDRRVKASEAQSPVIRLAERNPDIELKNRFWISNAVHLEVNTNVQLENIAGVKGVERMHHNFEVQALQSRPQNITEASVQASSGPSTYGLDKINATETWQEFNTRGESVKVSVLDTGIDVSHPDLELYTDNSSDPTYPGGWVEFYGGRVEGSRPNDCGSHGTHVSGTVSGGNASGENIGVAPNVELMHAGVLMDPFDCGSGQFSDILRGIEWSVENDADIISMSLGAEGYFSDFIGPIRNAEDAGVIMIAASGNNGTGTSIGPGNVYESFSVGAINSNNDVPYFSSGEKIDTSSDWANANTTGWPDQYIVPDIAAPGVGVKSSVPGGGYDSTFSGTSMATPHVSGAAALMQSATEDDLGPKQIKEAFLETAWKPTGWDESNAPESIGQNDSRYGKGIIDAYAATEYAIRRFDKGYLIQNLSVNETKVNLTDEFTVSGDIKNYKSQSQDIGLELRVNGSLAGNQTVNVEPESSSSFKFVTNISDKGLYNVTVNNKFSGTLSVLMPPPDFSITANLSDSEIVEGDSAVVNGTVDNSGGTGKAELRMLRNGTEINSTSPDIGFESSEAYRFNNTFDSPGFYEIKVNDTDAGSLDVLSDAKLNVTGLSLNKSGNFFENETVEASVTGQNVGGRPGNLSFELFLDGSPYKSENKELDSGENRTVRFKKSHTDRGNYTYSSGGLNETLEVLQPGSIELVSSSLKEEMVEGESLNYSVTLENPGDVQASSRLNFSLNGSIYQSINSTVEAGDTESINSSRKIETPGLYEISVNNSLEKTVNVLEAAELNQTGLTIEEEMVEGESILANSSVTNIGEVSGNFSVPFNVTGPEEHNYSKTVILNASNSKNVSYSRKIDSPGNYSLESLNRSRNFTVLNDADVRINSSTLNESAIFTGKGVEASTTIDNIGDVNGSDALNISLNEDRIVPTGNVEPGIKNLTDTFRPRNTGEYNLTVNGTNYDNLTVQRSEVNLSQPEFNVSESGLIVINFSLNNTDPGFVNETVPLSLNGTNQKNSTFNLRPDEDLNASITVDLNETGFYNLELNNSEIGNFSLDNFAEFSGLSPDSASFEEGDNVILSGDINSVGSPNITVVAGEKEFETNTSSGLSNFSFSSFFDPGSYEWSVTASFNNSSFQSDSLSFEVQEDSTGGSSDDEESSGSQTTTAPPSYSFEQPELEVEENDDSIRIDAPEGDHSIRFNDSGLPIRSLDFEASEAGTVNFSSTELDHSGSMESVFDVETGLEGPFTIEIELSKKWLEENRFNESQASFFRYEEAWEDKKPQSEQEQNYTVYSIQLEGASTFGVGVDQACYSMEEVDAVVNGSCRSYENICALPEDMEPVQSCPVFEREQGIERKIEEVKEDGSMDQREIDQAEEAFRTGELDRAERILEESQSNSRRPGKESGSFNIFYILIPSVLIMLFGLVDVIIPYYKRKRLVYRLTDVTEEVKHRDGNSESFQELSNIVERADEAFFRGNYREAEKLVSDAEKMM